MAAKRGKKIPEPSEEPGKKIRIEIPANTARKKPEAVSLEIKKASRPEKPDVTVSVFDSEETSRKAELPAPPKPGKRPAASKPKVPVKRTKADDKAPELKKASKGAKEERARKPVTGKDLAKPALSPGQPVVNVSIYDSPKQIKLPAPPKPARKAAPGKTRTIPFPHKPRVETRDTGELKKLKTAFENMNRSFGAMVNDVNSIKTRTSDMPDRKQMEEIRKTLEKKADFLKLSDSDVKSVKNFASRSGYLEKQVADVRSKLDDMVEVIDIFTNKVNTLRKAFEDMSSKPAGEAGKGYSDSMRDIADRLGKSEKNSSDMKKRIDEIEGALEQLSGNLKEKPSKPMEAKEMKAILSKISSLEDRIKETKEKADLEESKTREEKGPSPDSERLSDFDQRITGINDKLMQISGNLQKLSSYYMDGIRHIETRVNSLENRFYEEHGEELLNEVMKPQPARAPAPAPRQLPPAPPPAPFPTPYPEPAEQVRFPTPPVPYPEPAEQVRLPTPPAPERGNMFTKLRESTVVRIPYPVPKSEMPDLEILTEQVIESMHRNESAEKITRDLTYAGYDRDIISKAFMQARVG